MGERVVKCENCDELATNAYLQSKATVLLCDSCDHDAQRSGWVPEVESQRPRAGVYCDYCQQDLPGVKSVRTVPTGPLLQRMGFAADKVVCPDCVDAKTMKVTREEYTKIQSAARDFADATGVGYNEAFGELQALVKESASRVRLPTEPGIYQLRGTWEMFVLRGEGWSRVNSNAREALTPVDPAWLSENHASELVRLVPEGAPSKIDSESVTLMARREAFRCYPDATSDVSPGRRARRGFERSAFVSGARWMSEKGSSDEC